MGALSGDYGSRSTAHRPLHGGAQWTSSPNIVPSPPPDFSLALQKSWVGLRNEAALVLCGEISWPDVRTNCPWSMSSQDITCGPSHNGKQLAKTNL